MSSKRISRKSHFSRKNKKKPKTNGVMLSPQLAKVYSLFGKKYGVDVTFFDIQAALFPDVMKQSGVSSAVQRRISPYIVRLNSELWHHGERVVPGSLRQTYQLTSF